MKSSTFERRLETDPRRARGWARRALSDRLGIAALAVAAVVVASPLRAAPPTYGLDFTTVNIDGVLLGDDFTPTQFQSYDPTVILDNGTFHLWVHDDTVNMPLSSVVHATSSNGIDFTATGNLSYAGGPPYPAFGAATEPIFQFLRVMKLGADWKLFTWTPNVGASQGEYNYNVTVFNIGPNPNNLVVTHQGPVQPVAPDPGTGTSGQVNGMWGLIGTSLFTEFDANGGIARYTYTDGSPPSVSAPNSQFDVITGTGFVNYTINPADPLAAYPNNAARTLLQADGTLGTFYSLRTYPAGARANKQIYYIESGNGGATWSAPVGLFANGNLVRVDGELNGTEFSHPEVVLVNSTRGLYFSTATAEGKFVVVTSLTRPRAPEIPTLSGIGITVLLLALMATGALFLARTRT